MTTEGVIVLIWIVTLVIALGLTVGAVAMIVRIVYAAHEIDRLLKETLPSAVGVGTDGSESMLVKPEAMMLVKPDVVAICHV